MTARTALFVVIAMLAFAGNSVLCRLALQSTSIDPASFTAIRLGAGAMALWMIVSLWRSDAAGEGSIRSAAALFVYAAAFSFAYIGLTTATGALLLFGTVQLTMIGTGLWRGERLSSRQWAGLAIAIAGLLLLLYPGLAAPPLTSAMLMVLAGVAWGVYSLRGRAAGDPTRISAGNFALTLPMAALLLLLGLPGLEADLIGIALAVGSGALASGAGYAIWYAALPALQATHAATVQLSVPVLAAIGGLILVDEPVTARLILASAAVLGGIALVIFQGRRIQTATTARRVDDS
jgi:drug/metabolite transporter (DMT)-like permease